MKKAFLGSVALVALSLGTSAAFAAEKRVPAAPAYVPPPPVPVYTWSGCYIGANAGYSSGTSTHSTTGGSAIRTLTTVGPVLPAGANITDSFNLSGFIGGGQLGCNWQWGVWIFGIEGDGSGLNKEGQAFELPLVPVIGGAAGAARANWISQTQERWLVTARAKLGFTWWDKSIVYVTGGGAWAKIDISEWLAGNPIPTGHQESTTRSGWTVGAGTEYALGYGWSLKGEYLYVKFDDFNTFTTGPFAVVGGNVGPRQVRLEDHIFRGGINYKFW
jgi:outer membrane immunogenic protein